MLQIAHARLTAGANAVAQVLNMLITSIGRDLTDQETIRGIATRSRTQQPIPSGG